MPYATHKHTETRKGRHFELTLHEGPCACEEEVNELKAHGSFQLAHDGFPTSFLGAADREEYCRVTLASYLDRFEREGRL